MKLNVGCGRNPLDGWVNLDIVALPGVDVVADLERCHEVPLPFADDSVEEFLLSHVLEHLQQPLRVFEELWRVAAPSAVMTVRCPHGASDDAWEDPTHVRPIFHGSFGYFSQPYYWRADYGYRGDWKTTAVDLFLTSGTPNSEDLWWRVQRERNLVVEVVAHLEAVKPARPPSRELQYVPEIRLRLT